MFLQGDLCLGSLRFSNVNFNFNSIRIYFEPVNIILDRHIIPVKAIRRSAKIFGYGLKWKVIMVVIKQKHLYRYLLCYSLWCCMEKLMFCRKSSKILGKKLSTVTKTSGQINCRSFWWDNWGRLKSSSSTMITFSENM